MRPAASLRLALLGLAALAAACGGDDAGTPIDAGGPDAPACTLPATVITCTAGDDTPCTSVCGNAYCHVFNMVGTVCTQACAVAEDCPAGWSCNNMGRCRPPG